MEERDLFTSILTGIIPLIQSLNHILTWQQNQLTNGMVGDTTSKFTKTICKERVSVAKVALVKEVLSVSEVVEMDKIKMEMWESKFPHKQKRLLVPGVPGGMDMGTGNKIMR